MASDFKLYGGDVRDVLSQLPDGAAHCCVTSPPYLDARSEYGTLNAPEWRLFFRELRRVVTGPALFNCGRLWRDGLESDWHRRLVRIAALEGWEQLDEIVWFKPNANPIQGKFLTNSHEYVYILGSRYSPFNGDAIRTEYSPETLARFQRKYKNGTGVKGEVRERDGRTANEKGARARSVFVAYSGREKGNPHPAPMAMELAEHMVLASSSPGQVVLDPFLGSGTTAVAALTLGRRCIGIEKDAAYAAYAASRLSSLTTEAAA